MWILGSGGCFTNVSRALQDILSKFVYCRNCTSYENFKLKLCTSAQSLALGTCTKFQLEILTINVISDIVYLHEIVLESLRNVSETTPSWPSEHRCHSKTTKMGSLFLSHFWSKYSYIVLRYWPQKSPICHLVPLLFDWLNRLAWLLVATFKIHL